MHPAVSGSFTHSVCLTLSADSLNYSGVTTGTIHYVVSVVIFTTSKHPMTITQMRPLQSSIFAYRRTPR